ncbi:hypothetical protein CC1G_02848 [Coprinopsis cinerea okayama7|uniref:P-loop containing nucleoside triphosphate hydrolase protein n=1 Tax=Coprinopsis cinerea (strain Okayama-7 / 130 / ATCC MYA-4618 / FGSC 9003) TaxID=240176 RepID=A8N079_COPC7|nr:hypothetical protein CC1G_02848 [Coprinopsis cinerea okayama7\|eukprot:XP_001828267.1 hypothetical protein CC1G_02848 [Coprinopsis cinerea okayama7\
MDGEAQQLAEYLVTRLQDLPTSHKRLIVGISGIPASGKSTFAQLLVEAVNRILRGTSDSQAILVGLDGWHLSRAQLDALPDPKLAHERRGAHWTFDGEGYVQFVTSLRDQDETVVLTAPTFDHALKDPTPHAISIHPFHRIVLIEGLYAFLSIEPWVTASNVLDERWWIEVDENEARNRLVKRHVVTGVTSDEETALHRADHNDLPNGRFIRENMLVPTKVIHSRPLAT